MTPTDLALALGLPLAAVVAIVLLRGNENLREGASLLAAVALFAVCVSFLPAVTDGAGPTLTLFEFLPGIAFAFHLEPLGVVFACIVAFLWFFTVLYAVGYMRGHGEENQTRFYAFFAISIFAAIGGALSANLLTLYFFYEALTLATWPLVTHGGKDKDRAGGRTYLAVLLGTSLTLLLVALIWTWTITGSLAFTPGGLFGATLPVGMTPALLAVLYTLFLFGTGKAALMPFHGWLPAAMVAPTPVSALLHAVAVVKLGVFTVLKVTVYVFGIDVLTRFEATTVMQWVAAGTLLIAAVRALFEDNLKRRLAYSTISQLAYIVLAATLATPVAIMAGGMHIAVHAFAKITLFFCAGMILVAAHRTQVSELPGLARQMPFTIGAWLVASLCVIGLPLTGGFWSKWYLAQGAWAAGEPWLLATILAGSLLAAGYLLPPVMTAFRAAPVADGDDESRHDDGHAHGDDGAHGSGWRFEAPTPSLIAMFVTAAGTVVLFVSAEPLLALLAQMLSTGGAS